MSVKLRIVHCFRSPVGGIFRHVRDLAEAQAAQGHEVGIICDSTTGGALEQQRFLEIEPFLALGIHRLPMQRHVGIGDVTSAWRTFRLIKSLRPNILHGHGAKGGVHVRLFGSVLRVFRYRVARLYSPHGGVLHYDEDTVAGRLFFFLERTMGRFCDHILFVSDHERRTYLRKVGSPHSPATLVYNGVRDSEFAPILMPDDRADFLYIGMMRDLKGPDLFIEAMSSLRVGHQSRVTAVMVGDGDDLPRFQLLAEDLRLSDRIRFLPAMPVREAFALGDIMVVPSRAEAMPYIVLEALAAGKSIIATSVGGIPEVLGMDSIALVEPTTASIARRMEQAMESRDELAAAMPSATSIRSRFSVSSMAAQIETIYRSALNS